MGLLRQATPFICKLEEEMRSYGTQEKNIAEDRHIRRFHAALSRMSLATLAKHMLEPLSEEANQAFEALRENV